ncbi:conserved hypothetical protein [Planktothrix agardhii]|uniref:hypothetical protein n=1 Tax=Planktothrix agardhii TaxID=1160 RepID=UPI001BA43179|nr:hypothetical protein [Planktothrix agardhii]CAD0228231.1 conserved hypothetical protein [Planktothrix agardhii]
MENHIIKRPDEDVQALAQALLDAKQQVGFCGDELPLVCSGVDILPTLGDLPELTVNAVMAMTQRHYFP